jgi:hypothetical protein
MTLRFGLVTVVLGFIFASTYCVPGAAADPFWKMVETTCESSNNGCQEPLGLPLVIGTIEGSGFYHDDGANFFEGGNLQTNFPVYLYQFGSRTCLGGACRVDINLTSTRSGVSGNFFYEGPAFIDLEFNGQTFEGFWGSDNRLPGCGTFAQCIISGVLVSAPEPSTAPLLAAALLVLLLWHIRHGRRSAFARRQTFADTRP